MLINEGAGPRTRVTDSEAVYSATPPSMAGSPPFWRQNLGSGEGGSLAEGRTQNPVGAKTPPVTQVGNSLQMQGWEARWNLPWS